MNATKEVELLENSQVKVKINIPSADIKGEYDAIVKDYCLRARLPGFRKGKIPADVLIRKLGPALVDETRAQVLEKCITEMLPTFEQKPLPYDSPDVKSESPLELGKDFTFELVYDTYPVINLGPYSGLEIEQPEWQITDEDIGRELEGIRNQQAMFIDKASGAVESGNIVNIDYVELDEAGAEKAGTKRDAFVFEIGSSYNLYKIDEEITGMKTGETKTFSKTYPAEFENKDLAGKTVSLKVTVNAVKEKKLPEVNDELAQDINEKFKTLDDLKADIRKKLEEAVKNALRSRSLEQIMDRIVESSTIPLPHSLVEYQLGLMWEDYANRLQMDEKTLLSILEKQGKTVDDIRKEWMPAAEKRAKLQLVITEIGKKENIEIEDGELDAEISRMAESRQVEAGALKESLSKQNLISYMKSNLKVDKLYDFILSKTQLKTGGSRKVLDILTGN